MRDKPENLFLPPFAESATACSWPKRTGSSPLELCDSLPTRRYATRMLAGGSSWRMNGVMGGAAQERTFSDDDLLAPCSTPGEIPVGVLHQSRRISRAQNRIRGTRDAGVPSGTRPLQKSLSPEYWSHGHQCKLAAGTHGAPKRHLHPECRRYLRTIPGRVRGRLHRGGRG